MYQVYCDQYLIFDTRNDDLKIIDPQIVLELNKTGSFTFTIFPSHPHYGKLRKLKSIIQVYQDDYLLFRGRILDDEVGFYNEKQVICEGELAFLLDSIQRPYDFLSGDSHTTIPDLFAFFINHHNAQVDDEHRFHIGNITVTDPNDYIVRSDSTYMNTWDSINKKLIEPCGGYLWIRHEQDGNYIDYLEDFNTISNQTIEFGKNLLDINRITKGENIATAIIPLGAKLNENSEERLTIASVNEGIDYIYSQEAVDRYGWIFKPIKWDDVTEAANLLRKGNEALASAMNLIVSIDLSAVDLAAMDTDINAFHLGTYIHVFTKPHDLDADFLVTKLSINLSDPTSNTLTLGATYLTFTEQTSSATTTYESTVQRVTEIENNYSKIQADVDQKTSSAIGQISTEIFQQVSEDYYLRSEAETLMQSVNMKFLQADEEFELRLNEFQKDVETFQVDVNEDFRHINKYVKFIDGNIVIGEEGNQLTLKIQNDKIAFLENGSEIGYWKNRKFYAADGEFINSLQLGNFAFVPRTNGNLSFKKVN